MNKIGDIALTKDFDSAVIAARSALMDKFIETLIAQHMIELENDKYDN